MRIRVKSLIQRAQLGNWRKYFPTSMSKKWRRAWQGPQDFLWLKPCH
jgi:hypothetical protein